MEVDRAEFRLLRHAINEWEQAGRLSPAQAEDLRKNVVLKQTQRQLIAQYFFVIALFCILLAFGTLFLNDKLLEKLKVYFSWNDLAIACLTAALAVLWFWYVARTKNRISKASYEIYMVLGGLTALTSLIYICKQFGADSTYTAFFGIAALMLAVISTLFKSRSLWTGALIGLLCWFWTFSTWQSHDNLYFGMNYPMRFTVLGFVILLGSLVQKRIKAVAGTQDISYVAGLIVFFTGFWAISIFGNFNTIAGWHLVRQVHVLAYAVSFGIASAITFYLGIKYDDELARDFGVLFLLINLYTRYFEYFWDNMNKGLFFLVLAITFAILGRWLERKKRSGFITGRLKKQKAEK